MKEIRDIISEFERHRGEPFAFATLVRADGSSYRRPGAHMLIATDRGTVGTLSGGCLEEELAARAQEVITSNVPILLHFDTRLRYGCHGAIDVFIEPLQPALLEAVAVAQRARVNCVVATVFENQHSLGSEIVRAPEEAAPGAFVQTIHPPVQLLLIGTGPDGPAFLALAFTLGWQIVEIDDAVTLPNEFDDWTAAIVKSHNYGRDFSALQALLPLGLRYVGLMGPRKRRDQLLADLFDRAGCINAEFFAPAGLDLGAETPEEIALAIVAEIQSVFAAASRGSLRDRKAPIHAIRYAPVAETAVARATR